MDSEGYESDSSGWETEEWETEEEEFENPESVYGDTDSWTTTHEFPRVENDSTTTDDSYSYTTDTSSASSLSDGCDEEVEFTDESTGSASSKSSSSTSSSDSLRPSDTEFGVKLLPTFRSIESSRSQSRRFKKPRTSPVLFQQSVDHGDYHWRSAQSVSLMRRPGEGLTDGLCYEIPTLSPSWWQPLRHIRVGIGNSIRRYWKFSRQWKCCAKCDHARRWKELYHLRVVMSTASWKQPRIMLHGERMISCQIKVISGLNHKDDEGGTMDVGGSSDATAPTQPNTLDLPKGYRVYSRQAGGHHYLQGAGKIGLLEDMNNLHILKHLPYERSHREAMFYEELSNEFQASEQSWPCFIPRFYGRRTVRVNGVDHPFIELDDFTAGLEHPNILDIKLGGVDKPGDNPQRIEVRATKYPLYQDLGFRIDGCQIYNRTAGSYTRLSAKANRTLEELKRAVQSFLNAEDPATDSVTIVKAILPKLNEIEEWVSKQTTRRFYSVSTLMAYEPPSTDSEPVPCRVALVDFVHVFKADGVDEMCLKGLRKLKSFLEENAAPKRKSGSG